jgi:hypothetical protein
MEKTVMRKKSKIHLMRLISTMMVKARKKRKMKMMESI